jgi:uroporphyrinogen decarboxylase
MVSRERVKRAIYFEDPDRVPHFLPDDEGNDLLWLWPNRPPEKQSWTEIDGIDRRIDGWGVVWERPHGHAEYGEAKEYPIKDITKHLEYTFPDCNDDEYFKDVAQAVSKNNAYENPKYCLAVMPFSSLNEGTHNIRGLHNMFIDYYEHPDELKVLIGRLAQGQRRSIRKLADLGCDGVMGYDDWGLQDRLMVSIDMIEEFFMPHYRENWKLAHNLGMDVWMHSCGYIIEVLPEFVKAGLDVIQMDQQENIGLKILGKALGGKIAFWCPVDIQKTMVDGSIEDIQKYVKRMIEALGSHNGGLVSMAYTTPDAVGHTPEKIAAMCKAFREYGIYDK